MIGRIGAALEGKAAWLQTAIRECIERLTLNACLRAGIEPDQIGESVITGNTAMLHLLTGQNTEPLSHAPFHAETLFGTEYSGLSVPAYLPPCMDAFVGADITCAVLASGMCERDETALLTDIGTNGEVALWHWGKLYVTSTAAGPAFEGVGITCGCGSITGAIDRVWNENGKLAVHTIGEGAPSGLCGSGLIDAVAALLGQEWIDETGATETESVQIAGKVILTARNVRNVQLAKGAIAAGIRTVLHETGIGFDRITALYIAGGFGNHLNIDSAAAIGLIPQSLKNRVIAIGNAALSGAAALLPDPRNREKAERIAGLAHPVHLGGNPVFSNYYMDFMMFETC